MEKDNEMKVVKSEDKRNFIESKIHKLLINYFMEVRDKTFAAHQNKSAENAADILLEITGRYTELIETEFKAKQIN